MTQQAFPPKTPDETARQYAYRVLYNGIMTLQLEPGTVLSDAVLSESLGISRTPIREAIVSLVDARLVDVQPQKSSCVSRIDLDAVEEGVFLRYQVESAILKEVVAKAGGSDLALLWENLSKQRTCLEANDLGGYMDLDNEFHKLLYMAAGRPWSWETVERIITHHDRIRRLHLRMGREHLVYSLRDHETVFHNIATRSNADMDEFLYSHLTAGYRNLLPAMMDQYPDYFTGLAK